MFWRTSPPEHHCYDHDIDADDALDDAVDDDNNDDAKGTWRGGVEGVASSGACRRIVHVKAE